MNFVEMVIAARCGKLNWLCSCMDTTDEQEIRRRVKFLRSHTEDEIVAIAQYCSCLAIGGGSTQPPPGRGESGDTRNCTNDLLDYVCRNEVIGPIIIAHEAADLVALIPALPIAAKAPMIAMATALEALVDACAAKDITDDIVESLCSAWNRVKSIWDGLPDLIKDQAAGLGNLLGSTELAARLTACCAQIAAAHTSAAPGGTAL